MKVINSSGKNYELEETPAFGTGGEGSVYAIKGCDDKVIKIYNSSSATPEQEQKLRLMASNPPIEDVLNQVAWPLEVVYDEAQSFCGFVMPKLTIDADLSDLYKYPPDTTITYKQRLIIAENICAVINEVHKAGYIFGDFNPRNIGVDTNTGFVAFLDTDSYHIVVDKANNKAFRCKVCAQGYVAPELLERCADHIDKHPEDAQHAYATTPLDTFTKETDHFALAIHIFKLLMNGYSPFGGIDCNDRRSSPKIPPGTGDSAVRMDNYCFKEGKMHISVAVPSLEEIPDEIGRLFSRAFIDGRVDPSNRPDAIEWFNALKNYENELIICKRNHSHMYMKSLPYCPWCEADDRYSSVIEQSSIKQQNYGKPIQPLQNTSHKNNGNSQKRARVLPLLGVTAAIIVMIIVMLLKGCINNQYDNNQYVEQSGADNETKTEEELNPLNVPVIPERRINVKKETITRYKGSIKSSKQIDKYYFIPKRIGVYRLEFSGIRNNQSMYLEVYSPRGKLIDSGYYGNGDGITLEQLRKNKRYRIRISGESKSGSYILSVGKQKRKVDVSTYSQVSDSVQFTNQNNRYAITIPNDGLYRFELSELHNNASIELSICNSLNEEIERCYCSNGEGITLENAKKGEHYTINVSQSDGLSTYVLKIGNQKATIDISKYNRVFDSIQFDDQENVYCFTAESSCYTFSISELENYSSIALSIINRLGESESHAYCQNGDDLTIDDLQTGERYELHVKQDEGYSPYCISIE